MKAEVRPDGKVKLQLTRPAELKLDYPIQLDTKELFVSSVDTGVPHAVLFTDHVDMAPVEDLGRLIRYHKSFSPKGTNVDFVQVVDKENAQDQDVRAGRRRRDVRLRDRGRGGGRDTREKGLAGETVNIRTKGGESSASTSTRMSSWKGARG